MKKEVKPKKEMTESQSDFLMICVRVRGPLKERIEAEMKQKELDKAQPIVFAALRKRYGLEVS